MSELNKIKKSIDLAFMKGEITNVELVELIEQVASYGNIHKVSEYAKENGMTVQGVYKCRNVVNLLGYKFVLDND